MHILLISNNIVELMERHRLIYSHGLECDIAKTIKEVHQFLVFEQYCCILIDSETDKKIDFAYSKLCQQYQKAPVLYLGNPVDRIELEQFRKHSYDYLQKRWSNEQIWQRIRKSIEYYLNEPSVLVCKSLVLDQIERKTSIKGELLILTPLQFNILLFLMKNPDIIHSMETIYFNVWNKDEINPLETVQVNISRLRRKLSEADPRHEFISTIRSKGYRFNSK